MKLIWSLANKNPLTPHGQYVYDMFYVSIQMAKDLGYQTVLYGTTDAVDRLGNYVDEVHNIDNIEYILFDDLKIYIWKTRNDEYITIDGDMFLYSPLIFNRNSKTFLSFDEIVKKPATNEIEIGLNTLNNLNTFTALIPEWNIESKRSFSTNLIYWKENNGLLQYFIESYEKLRNWYFENKNILVEANDELDSHKSLISHLICEHLLERLIDYYSLEYDEIRPDWHNSYSHWQGNDKFINDIKINGIKLLVEKHKTIGGNIKNTYDYLLNEKMIQPFLYL